MGKAIKFAALATLALAVTGGVARAGDVIFKNGDRLTGEVTDLGGGKLKIKTKVAGEITVDLKDVATFTTDKPVELKLKDGSIVGVQAGPSSRPGTIVAVPTTQPVPSNSATPPVPVEPGRELAIDSFDSILSPPPVQKWTGNIKAGATYARGNTDTDEYHLGFEAMRRYDEDRLTFAGQYNLADQKLSSAEGRQISTDNWLATGKYDHFVTKKLYEYANLRLEHDRIADLYLRAQPGVGLGYQWIETPRANFSTEAGLGYTIAEYDAHGDEDSRTDTYVNARLAYHYDRVLRENVKFVHNVEYLPSLEDVEKFNVNADAGIRVTLTEKLFTEFKAEWRYDSQPAEGVHRSDFRYILSLGWEF